MLILILVTKFLVPTARTSHIHFESSFDLASDYYYNTILEVLNGMNNVYQSKRLSLMLFYTHHPKPRRRKGIRCIIVRQQCLNYLLIILYYFAEEMLFAELKSILDTHSVCLYRTLHNALQKTHESDVRYRAHICYSIN